MGWEWVYTIIIFFPFPYSNNLHIDPKIHEHCWKEIENVKTQLEEQHAQEVEHLKSYFQQQLKESEERYTAEIVHLQDKLRSDEVSSDYTRYNQFFNAYNFVLHTNRSVPNNCSCKAMCFTLKFEKLFINTSFSLLFFQEMLIAAKKLHKHYEQHSATFRTKICCKICCIVFL